MTVLLGFEIASGAFEGADLFRTMSGRVDGIFPPAMNCPARLPEQPFWLGLGRGQPLGRSWAAFQTVSLGGRVKTWQGAVSLWSSGDELYRETNYTATLAKRLPTGLVAGLSLSYLKVLVDGFDPVPGQPLMGIGVAAPLTTRLDASVWYSGQPLDRKQAYESLAQQLFQLALNARIGELYHWTVALEKTPSYTLRQLSEISITSPQGVQIRLGYRTSPGMPFAGAQVSLKRLVFSLLVNYHPIFGLSTAFGFAFP